MQQPVVLDWPLWGRSKMHLAKWDHRIKQRAGSFLVLRWDRSWIAWHNPEPLL
jgi:hypothetical protein